MSGRLRRARSEIVGRFRVFDVARHELVDAAGRFVRDSHTFSCPDWVSVTPVTDDGRVLLVRQYRDGIDGPTLEIPGGVVDAGESPEACAVRELREETGYAARTLEPLGSSHPNPPLQGNRHHMFLARGVHRVGGELLDAGEDCEVVSVALAEAEAMVRAGAIVHELVEVAMRRAFDRLAEPR